MRRIDTLCRPIVPRRLLASGRFHVCATQAFTKLCRLASALGFLGWASGIIGSAPLAATPLLAVKDSQSCAGCHNPGRSEKPLLERRCTLDCQGCHIDPNGGGPRNQWGNYYIHATLPTIGFFKPADPLTDTSRFDVHTDSRIMGRRQGDTQRRFPMNNELSLRLRPFIKWLHLTYQLNVLGRSRETTLVADKKRRYHFQEKYAVMVDNLPLNMYVRAARGTPMYGQRRPNHSSWIRERIGLGQFALTDALSVGGTPTVPFMHYSYMLGNPLDAPEDRQKGTSFHGGMRGVSFGWNLHGSAWDTRSTKATIAMQAISGGANIFDFVIMAEKNWRKVTAIDVPLAELLSYRSPALRLHPSSTISEASVTYTGLRGANLGVVWEAMTSTNPSTMQSDDSRRRSYYIDLHPIPFLQLEYWQRYETGARQLADSLWLVHFYSDI